MINLVRTRWHQTVKLYQDIKDTPSIDRIFQTESIIAFTFSGLVSP